MRQALLYAVIPLVLALTSVPTRTWIVLPAALDVQGQAAHLLSPGGLDNFNGGILGHALTEAIFYNKLNSGYGLKEYSSSRNKRTFSFSSPMLVHQTYAKLSNELRYYAGSRAHARPPKGASPGWGVPRTWRHKALKDTAGLFVLPILYFALTLWRWLLTFWCFTIDQPRVFPYTSPMSASPASPMPTTPLDAAALLCRHNARRAMKSAASRKRKMRYAKLLCLGWVVLFSLPQVSAMTAMQQETSHQAAALQTPAGPSSSSLDNSSINHEQLLEGVRGSSDDTSSNHIPNTVYPCTVIEDPESPVLPDSPPQTSTESTPDFAVEFPNDSSSERSHEPIVDSSSNPPAASKKRKRPASSNPPAAKKKRNFRKCLASGCMKKPTYGYEGGGAERCKKHVMPGMTITENGQLFYAKRPVVKRRVTDIDETEPNSHLSCSSTTVQLNNYLITEGPVNEPLEKLQAEPKRCRSTQDKSPRRNGRRVCKDQGCILLPSFNVEGQTRGIYCADHKLPGMINVKSKRCEFDGCITQPIYNVEGQTRGIYCSDHKLPGMVNVKDRRCKFGGCITIPLFNVDGQTRGVYCADHKLPGMINVKSKRCEFDGCITVSIYNIEGQTRGIYCSDHKLPGMVNVKDRRCDFDGCTTLPSYNVDGQTRGVYCADHKLPGMIDVISKRCDFDGCVTIPSFNVEGQLCGIYCSEHKLSGMINVTSNRCEFSGCLTQPCFNVEGQTRGIYCKKHKLTGMIDVLNKRCEFNGCLTQPSYNVEGHTRGIYCADHKLPGMIDVRNKQCDFDGCNTHPSYNVEGQTRGIYCADHKLPGMVDVKSKRCEHNGCLTQPCFNVEGHIRGIYCADHKLPGMVDVTNKQCNFDGCITIPSFNVEGQTRGIYCADHKLPDMINVKGKRCEFDGCITQPSFNVDGQTSGIYCADHKLPDMINVNSKRCEFDGCITQPSFNVEGQTLGIYCADHKLPGMVNVKDRRCDFDGCDTIPSFNEKGQTLGIYCADHKLSNMVNVISKRCEVDGCITIPSCNVDGQTRGIYCAEHKLSGMINVISKRCVEPGCDKFVDPKTYDCYCMTCFAMHFPDEPIRVNRWENAMSNKILEWKASGKISDGGKELTLLCQDHEGITRRLRLDAWIRSLDDIILGFEADGPTHFSPVLHYTRNPERAEEDFIRQYNYDRLKERHCQEKGISLLRISELDVKVAQFGHWMDEALLSLGQMSSEYVTLSHPSRYADAKHLFNSICAMKSN